MASTVSVRIDESLLRELSRVEDEWKADRSEVIRRLLGKAIDEWKAENALEKLRKQEISIGKAAEEASVSLWEIMDLARERDIDWTGYTEEDLKKDLTALEG